MQIDYTTIKAAFPALLLLLVAEAIYLYKEKHEQHAAKNLLTGAALNTVGLVLNFFGNSVVIILFAWIYQYRLFNFDHHVILAWVACFFADDLSYYWYHRCSHQVRFLWASHMVHHSSESYTLAGGIRVPWTSYLSGTFLFWAWMPLIGISPAMVLLMKSTSTIYQFWLHTERIQRLPKWFEFIFNTPSHHRVHHASNAEYLDKNHAGTLIVWDRMFGTFMPETKETHYGITENIGSYNPFVIAFHEWKKLLRDWRSAGKLSDRWNHLFNAPGWSRDGSTMTTKQIQSRLLSSTDLGKSPSDQTKSQVS